MIAAAGAYRTFDVLGSPGYPNSLHHISETWAESPSRAVGAILELSTANLSKLLAWSTDAPPQVVLRYFLVLFIAVLGVRVLVARPREQACADATELACVTVAPLFAITLLVGEVESWRDFRLLSPALLVALLLLVPHCRWERWLWSLTLVLTPLYWAGFAEFHRDRFTTRDVAITTMRDATRTVRFVRDASPWDNTVLVHADLLQFPLLGLPSGIAVSYVTNWDDLASPIRSRFLLLRHDDREQIESRIRLAPVAETPLGTLYTNLGTAEPRPAS
jgi:hypothetical protein